MSNFTRHLLSGSTNGKQIKVVATATLGTTIHAATTGTTNIDMVYLYAVNSSGSTSHLLTIEWGGATVPDDTIEYTVPPSDGYKLIVPGLPLQNDLVITAFAAAANTILIGGYVDRYLA